MPGHAFDTVDQVLHASVLCVESLSSRLEVQRWPALLVVAPDLRLRNLPGDAHCHAAGARCKTYHEWTSHRHPISKQQSTESTETKRGTSKNLSHNCQPPIPMAVPPLQQVKFYLIYSIAAARKCLRGDTPSPVPL